MKIRKYLILGAISSILLAQVNGARLVLAENFPEQHVIVAKNHQEISGHYTIGFENEEMIIRFLPQVQQFANQKIQEINLQVGVASDQKKVSFKEVEEGWFEARLAKNFVQDQEQLAIEVKTDKQENYIFEKLAYEWPAQEVTSTELSQTTLAPITSSETSVATSSSEITSGSNSEVRSQETPTLKEVREAASNSVSLTAQEANGKFDVLASNLSRPSEITAVRVAIWSEKNGQDDLKWYPMPLSNNSGKLTVDIKDHRNQSDNYIVHVYVYYKTGDSVGIDAGNIAIVKPAAKNQLTTRFSLKGLEVNLVSNQVSDYRKVRFAIWGEKNGQDDLKWYTASANGSINLPYTSLAGLDNYQVHAYMEENGKMLGLTTTSVRMEMPAVTSNVTKISAAQYKIEVKNVPDYVTSLQIPVWSENKGQDDIRWYTANKVSSGNYELKIQLSNHNFDTGKYQAHLYAMTSFGKNMMGMATVNNFQVDPLSSPSATIAITNVNTQLMRFDVIVSNVVAPGGLQSVQVPVWSEVNGQDDIRWYRADKQADGNFKVTVSISDHNYSFGRYYAHAYLLLGNSQMVGVGASSLQMDQPVNVTKIQATYQGMGNYSLIMSPVLTTGRVKFAIWSEVDGQDDIRWYDAYRQQGVVFAGGFNAQNHSGTGLYHIHAYEEVNGQMRGLGTTTLNVSKSYYNAPYYSQLDPRWSGIRYGAWNFGPSGCVPTSMAMIISGISGSTVSPVQVANYLHYNTLEYNRNFFGTSSRGIVMAARNWGYSASALNSYGELETALKQGYYVAAGVGPSRYVLSGGHEIVLKGYQNGMTYVLDPYNPNNNGWTSLAYIWSIPSTDPIDRTEGMPFIRISD